MSADITNRELDRRINLLEIRMAVIETKMNIIGYLAGTTLAATVTVLIAVITGVRL